MIQKKYINNYVRLFSQLIILTFSPIQLTFASSDQINYIMTSSATLEEERGVLNINAQETPLVRENMKKLNIYSM